MSFGKRKIDVEMQVTNSDDFLQGAFFYASHAYLRQLKIGIPYSAQKPVDFFTITDYNMFPVSEISHFYSNHYIMSDEASSRNTLKELK